MVWRPPGLTSPSSARRRRRSRARRSSVAIALGLLLLLTWRSLSFIGTSLSSRPLVHHPLRGPDSPLALSGLRALSVLSEGSHRITSQDVAQKSSAGDDAVSSSIPRVTGVYAIYSEAGMLQYVGLSREIRKSVEGHIDAFGPKESGGVVAEVRWWEMPEASRDVLKRQWESVLKSHIDAGGQIPPGNLPAEASGADPRWRKGRRAQRPPLRLGRGQAHVEPEEAIELVKQAVQKHPVVLFMKGTPAMPLCGFSARSIRILTEIAVPFESVDVMDITANPGIRAGVKEYSRWPTIPQLFVEGELVGGADIIAELFQTGELQQLLDGASGNAGSAGNSAKSGNGQSSQPSKSMSSNLEYAPFVQGEIELVNDPARPTAALISRRLQESLDLLFLSITDESQRHAGHAAALEQGVSSETHLILDIVASDFQGLMPVERQQKVFDLLSDIMPRVHAMSLLTRAPDEVKIEG